MSIDHPFAEPGGLTLPVWVAAAAQAATHALLGRSFQPDQSLIVPDRSEPLLVPVRSAATLSAGKQALAISHCDPGPGLDLTMGMEIWVWVQWQQLVPAADSWLCLVPGVGVGTIGVAGPASVSGFAQQLLELNLRPLVPEGQGLRLEVVLPRGKDLAARTSNASFGVVDGLALIGTQAEVQVSASPEQLQNALEQLRHCCGAPEFSGSLTLVIGENGLDLADQLGLDSQPVIKAGNWLGPMLVAAAEADVERLLLLGYHGKLIKLAGGIFHTHHHLADARLEVLTALAVQQGLPLELIQPLSQCDSMDEAWRWLELRAPDAAAHLWQRLADVVERRSAAYVARYGAWPMHVGAALFDRSRRLRWAGPRALEQLAVFGISPQG
ncbi:MAG: cobalt-precorrin-5B (C(1))-methyltransferase CbiD [Prochlorococcus sp.]